MELVYYRTNEGQPVASVLLSHGFAEHHGRYRWFIERMNQSGLDVVAFDFARHGTAPGRRRATVDVGRLVDEHLEARRLMRARSRAEHVLLFGHSMGGMVALASALREPAGLAAVAVTGPALRPLPPVPTWLARVGAGVGRAVPVLKSIPGDDSFLTHDKEFDAGRSDDPLGYFGAVPLLTGATMILRGRETLARAGELAVPTLILHGGDDRLSDVAASREFVARSGGLAELRVKDGDYHELLSEFGREAYAQEIIGWYASRLT